MAGAVVTYSCIRRWTTLDLFKIPSPWGLPGTGQLIQLAMYAYNPHQQFLKWHEALGSIVRLRIFHRDVVLVADPQVAAQLLAKGPNECYRRAPEYATYDAVSCPAVGGSCQFPAHPGHAWRVGSELGARGGSKKPLRGGHGSSRACSLSQTGSS